MKTKTFFLPAAFAVPALLSTLPASAPAIASQPVAARPNALLDELDRVVGGSRATNVLLDGTLLAVVVPPNASMGSSQCKTRKALVMSSACKGSKMSGAHTNALIVKSATHPPVTVSKSRPIKQTTV